MVSPGEEGGQGGKGGSRKAGELLSHLQALLSDPESEPNTVLETLDYFLARLSSMQSAARVQALSGLRLLLTPPSEGGTEAEGESDWLLVHLPSLPHFSLVYRSLATQLRAASQVIMNTQQLIPIDIPLRLSVIP